MSRIIRVLIQNYLHQNKNREEVNNREIRYIPDLSIFNFLPVKFWGSQNEFIFPITALGRQQHKVGPGRLQQHLRDPSAREPPLETRYHPVQQVSRSFYIKYITSIFF